MVTDAFYHVRSCHASFRGKALHVFNLNRGALLKHEEGSEQDGARPKYQVAKLVKTRGMAETRGGGAKGVPLSLPNLESVSPIRESPIFSPLPFPSSVLMF